MGDFFSFKTMVTPAIIKALFVLSLIGIVIAALLNLFVQDGIAKLIAFPILLVGPVVARIYCEILIVVFSIHERLGEISDNTRR